MVYNPVSVLRSETLFSKTPVGTCLKFGQTANTNMMNDCRRSFPNRRVLSLIYLPFPCFGWDHASNRRCDHVPFEHARLQPNVASSYNRRGSCYSNQSTQPWWCRVLRHWLHYKQHVKQYPSRLVGMARSEHLLTSAYRCRSNVETGFLHAAKQATVGKIFAYLV